MSNDYVYTTYIRTTPEKVWQAITNPEFTRQFWGGQVNVSDWKKGSKWEHRDAGSNALRLTGEVLESKPPKSLVVSWTDPENAKDTSRCTYDIEAVHDMVRLTVTHGNFAPGYNMREKISGGWPLVLSSMKSFLETGKAVDIFAIKAPCAGGKKDAAA
jgi:uncharacterized protein YndB with AHSA1/START domain